MSQSSFGPVILDILGAELTSEEKEILQHPLVSGVILFSRNYSDPKQIHDLCRQIRSARKKPLIISVDHEGGRVQRFREGFTRIPAMGLISQASSHDQLNIAKAAGWVMAAELLSVGIDLSFAPVLDLDKGICPAIGDRSFSNDPAQVIQLAMSVMQGMSAAGMVATGKHFPGHGSVNVDSHEETPVDKRSFAEIEADDLKPFVHTIQNNIAALMPAHIIFPEVDDKPVGFSSVWLQEILRKKLGFQGVIFSDDLNMKGASFAGDYASRAESALSAGCDIVLICNNRHGAIQILDKLPQVYTLCESKFRVLQGRFNQNFQALQQTAAWKEYNTLLRTVFTEKGYI